MEKRKIYGMIIGIIAFVALVLGMTYAFYSWSSNPSDNINVNLTVSKSLENSIIYVQGNPILSTDNKELSPVYSYTDEGAISTTIEFWKKENVTKTIYGMLSMEILNMLSASSTTDANIAKTDTIKWVVTTYNVNNANEVLLQQGTFNGKSIGDKYYITPEFELNNYQTFYKIYLWLDASAIDTTKSVTGELLSTEISASATDTESVYEVIVAQETLNRLGLTVSEGSPDFTKTSCSSGCEEATVGLYEYEDDLGTSYYFRGDVENNYVKFGKFSDDVSSYYCYRGVTTPEGSCSEVFDTFEVCQLTVDDIGGTCSEFSNAGKDMYWRIIRINGDGTVRMIYDGTQAWENGVSSGDRHLPGIIGFNYGMEDNAFVGYMFGQIGVIETGTTGYNLTHANDNNSTTKTYLEGELSSSNTGWYYENIVATGYHQYVADAIYCNDRSIETRGAELGIEGTGIGIEDTLYGAIGRLTEMIVTDVEPQLICTNSNDRFTISNSILAPTDELGTNQKLKYPIGLITADEVVLAGGKFDTDNERYYLNVGSSYWTMTPFGFSGMPYILGMSSSGLLSSFPTFADGYLRPVITLRSDALKFGNGTIGNEFRITE